MVVIKFWTKTYLEVRMCRYMSVSNLLVSDPSGRAPWARVCADMPSIELIAYKTQYSMVQTHVNLKFVTYILLYCQRLHFCIVDKMFDVDALALHLIACP